MNEQDKEAFGKWFDKNWQDSDDKDVFTQAWQAACLYKQKEIDELKLEYDKLTDWASEYVAKNRKLKECVEFYAKTESWVSESTEYGHLIEGIISSSDIYEPWGEQGISIGGRRAKEVLKELDKENG